MINQHAAPRITLHFHRGPAESSTHFVIDAGVPSVVVGEHVPYGYVEVSKTMGMHESYVLDAVSEGIEV